MNILFKQINWFLKKGGITNIGFNQEIDSISSSFPFAVAFTIHVQNDLYI